MRLMLLIKKKYKQIKAKEGRRGRREWSVVSRLEVCLRLDRVDTSCVEQEWGEEERGEYGLLRYLVIGRQRCMQLWGRWRGWGMNYFLGGSKEDNRASRPPPTTKCRQNIQMTALLDMSVPVFFTELALWVDSVYKLQCPCVCLSVCMYFLSREVPFTCLFAPIYKGPRSIFFWIFWFLREKLRKGSGLRFCNFGSEMV